MNNDITDRFKVFSLFKGMETIIQIRIQFMPSLASLLCKYTGTANSSDVVEIDNRYDTADFEVLVTGVDAHANFEGDFLILEPGINEFEYTGPTGATVAIYWRDTWL